MVIPRNDLCLLNQISADKHKCELGRTYISKDTSLISLIYLLHNYI